MKKILLMIWVGVMIAWGMVPAMAGIADNMIDGDEQTSIEADSFEYGVDGKHAIGYGNVVMRRGGMMVRADKVTYDQETDNFWAEGTVSGESAGYGTWSAEAVSGNAREGTINFGPFKVDSDVWHVIGESGTGTKNDKQVFTQTRMSTCDLESPHYSIKASRIVWKSNKTFSASNVVLRIGKVPVFWLPYIWGSTDNHTGYVIKPGYSSSRGAFVRLGRIWRMDNGLETTLYTDLMSKRGAGAGLKSEIKTEKREFSLNLYGMHDNDPDESDGRKGWNERFKTDKTRARAAAYLREQLDDNFTLRMNVDWTSDSDMLEDWFKKDYNRNNQPKSFINLAYDNSWMNGQLNFRPRVNSYNTEVQALPELKINIPRIEIADTGILYNSENSAGFYRMSWRDYDMNRTEWLRDYCDFMNDPEVLFDNDDYHTGRFDTLHTLSRPFEFGDAFTLTPRVSGRMTTYTNTSKEKVRSEDVMNGFLADDINRQKNYYPGLKYDTDGEARTRFAMELGLEGRGKFYSDWIEWNNELLGVEGLRHVVMPYFNYTFMPEPTVDRDHIYFMDEIDRLDKENFLRLGIDQHWQTRRNGQIVDFASLETYYDQHFIKCDESEHYAGDLGNRLTISPMEKLTMWGTYVYDCGNRHLQRGEFGLNYGAENEINFRLRYVYLNNKIPRSTYSMGSYMADWTGESGYLKNYYGHSETIRAGIDIPLDSRTTLSFNWNYDFDESRFINHSYAITRKMHCWTWGVKFGWDDNDPEVVFMFRLNAFPNVKLDLDI